jgi:nicotinamide-nucleotide amidase
MKILKKLVAALKRRKLTIALAESCSGGYASYLLTKVPGSSKIFKGSLVVYSLEIKNKFFNIPKGLLEKTQGVSEDIAITLTKKVRKKINADIGGSIVGFAGPETKKGVRTGTIYIGFADRNTSLVKKYLVKGGRDIVRKEAAKLLIDLIYKRINL